MRDPHVEALYYKIGTGSESISYGDPPSRTFENRIGAFSLSDGLLTVELAEHFSGEKSARQLVDPFLRAWELHTDLTANLGQIRFVFQKCRIIDRNPPPPGARVVLQVQGSSISVSSGKAIIHAKCNLYPDPPESFAITTDVQSAFNRWARVREGKASLPQEAYFIYTGLVGKHRSFEQAVKTFEISRNVLDQYRIISSTKGEEHTARKADYEEITDAERKWLEAATRRIIIRMGEHASGTPLTKITLADLPPLP